MAYDEELAGRIRELVQDEAGVSEKRMFGGLAFLVDGHLAVSASGQGGLLLRVDPVESESLTSPPDVRPFEMGGRSMSGWLHVSDESVADEEELRRWVGIGLGYARTLPPK
jgi:hypothetical protein